MMNLRVVAPAVVGQFERAQDLQGLHALLAQPGAVEDGRGPGEVGVGEERLHGPTVTCGATPRTSEG